MEGHQTCRWVDTHYYRKAWFCQPVAPALREIKVLGFLINRIAGNEQFDLGRVRDPY